MRRIKTQCVSPKERCERKALEKKTIKGARKALKDYGRVFERLAKHDRA